MSQFKITKQQWKAREIFKEYKEDLLKVAEKIYQERVVWMDCDEDSVKVEAHSKQG